MEMDYRTVQQEAYAEFVERRSRFIGYCKPVSNEEDAVAFIAEKRKENWDAKHHVYAYVLREGQIRRYSDDGEPQGSAGVPVLDVLLKEKLTDCVVVVTRYFGGILLGTGGLVRAYSHGAKIAVDAAVRLDMRQCIQGKIACSYTQYGRVAALLTASGGAIEDTVYTDDVVVVFHLPTESLPALERELTDYSAGSLFVETIQKIFYPFPV